MMTHSASCLSVHYTNMKSRPSRTDPSAGSSTWLHDFCQLGLSSSTGFYIFLLANASRSGCYGKDVVEEVHRRVREGNLTRPEYEGCVTLQVSCTRKTRGPVAPLVRVAWAERPRLVSWHSVTPSVRSNRSQLSSTIIAGQLPVEGWHGSTGVQSILRPSGLGSLTYLSCPDALLSSPV